MTDFLLERKSDGSYGWAVGDDGDVPLTHTLGRKVEVSQRVLYSVSTIRGESVYDLDAGVDMATWQTFAPAPGVSEYLTSFVQRTEGVSEVISAQYTLSADRVLTGTVEYFVTGADSPSTFSFEVGGTT